jgi:hypothetical protein
MNRATTMTDQKDLLTTSRKALTVNLDEPKYGTFAEIVRDRKSPATFFRPVRPPEPSPSRFQLTT